MMYIDIKKEWVKMTHFDYYCNVEKYFYLLKVNHSINNVTFLHASKPPNDASLLRVWITHQANDWYIRHFL